MTDPQVPDDETLADGDGDDGAPSSPDPMAKLLKRSLAGPTTSVGPGLLPGVQRRIRKRSRGKFFADGWSTSDARLSTALIALAMLLVLAVAYFALGPIGIQ
jgi:hypothetical protein